MCRGYQCQPYSTGSQTASSVTAALTASPYNNFCQYLYFNTSTSATALDNIADQHTDAIITSIENYYYANYPIQIRWKEGDVVRRRLGKQSFPRPFVRIHCRYRRRRRGGGSCRVGRLVLVVAEEVTGSRCPVEGAKRAGRA